MKQPLEPMDSMSSYATKADKREDKVSSSVCICKYVLKFRLRLQITDIFPLIIMQRKNKPRVRLLLKRKSAILGHFLARKSKSFKSTFYCHVFLGAIPQIMAGLAGLPGFSSYFQHGFVS